MDESGEPARILGVNIDITERKIAEEAVSSMGGKLIEAQERERTWIARELHDDINQRLALVAMNLDRHRQSFRASAEEMRSVMGEATKRVSEVVSDIHAMSHRLHSSRLDTVGLVAASAGLCRELSERQKVEIEFHSEGVPKNLPEAITMCMFRVLQEALQNAAKHSGANQYRVSLVRCPNHIVLTVCDEGRGFYPTEALKGSGLGLTSMMERVKLVGGELVIDAKPKVGTAIRASVPLDFKTKSAYADD